MMISRLLFSSLLFWGAMLVSDAATDESTFLTVYYDGMEGLQEDPAGCNQAGTTPCTTTVVDLPLYLDEALSEQTDGYAMDSVCVKRDDTYYDCTFTVKTPTERISFEGPLNHSDNAPDVFDLKDHEGTATLILFMENSGSLVGKIDIARVPEDSAAAANSLSSLMMVALAFLFGSFL